MAGGGSLGCDRAVESRRIKIKKFSQPSKNNIKYYPLVARARLWSLTFSQLSGRVLRFGMVSREWLDGLSAVVKLN